MSDRSNRDRCRSPGMDRMDIRRFGRVLTWFRQFVWNVVASKQTTDQQSLVHALRVELAESRQRVLLLEHIHHSFLQKYNRSLVMWMPLVAELDQAKAVIRDLQDQIGET